MITLLQYFLQMDNKINGGINDGPMTITTEGQGLTFVYVDGTVGWLTIHDSMNLQQVDQVL